VGERIEPTRQTLTEYANEWLERQTVRPRTLAIYKWALNVHLIPYFGRRRLDQITAEDIAVFIAVMRRKKLKGWTITSAFHPLSMILAQAARKGGIPVNPMTQLKRGERPSHDDERPKRILALDETRALIDAADSTQYRCLFELSSPAASASAKPTGSPSQTSTPSTRSPVSNTSSTVTVDASRSRPMSRNAQSTSRPS
jgi:hypothetical protein